MPPRSLLWVLDQLSYRHIVGEAGFAHCSSQRLLHRQTCTGYTIPPEKWQRAEHPPDGCSVHHQFETDRHLLPGVGTVGFLDHGVLDAVGVKPVGELDEVIFRCSRQHDDERPRWVPAAAGAGSVCHLGCHDPEGKVFPHDDVASRGLLGLVNARSNAWWETLDSDRCFVKKKRVGHVSRRP